MRSVGVIPARGPSRGVPRKNLRLVAGKPLLAYAIECARSSRLLTDFYTTTEDPEIAQTASDLGSAVIQRPTSLASDEASTVDVVRHVLECIEADRPGYDVVVVLQPTAPIRTGSDIDRVISMLASEETIDSVVSVCLTGDVHPARMYTLGRDGSLTSLWPEFETHRRQELPPVCLRNGAIYAARRHLIMEHRTLLGPKKRAYVMPAAQLANVDDERDLAVANVLVELWKRGEL